MAKQFAVVFEDEPDFQIATELADRVLLGEITWLDDEAIAFQREWVNEVQGTRLKWLSMPSLFSERFRGHGKGTHGHFDGEPGCFDALAGRRAIYFCTKSIPELDALVLIRDTDKQPQRKWGLNQARGEYESQTANKKVTVVIGLANTKRECWVICGFDAKDSTEQESFERLKGEVGFDPRCKSKNLLAGIDPAKNSAKRALALLTNNDRDREAECWRTTPLNTLRERGTGNGLRDYLDEVKDRLVPLVGGITPRQKI